jgi:hypothetical protein
MKLFSLLLIVVLSATAASAKGPHSSSHTSTRTASHHHQQHHHHQRTHRLVRTTRTVKETACADGSFDRNSSEPCKDHGGVKH